MSTENSDYHKYQLWNAENDKQPNITKKIKQYTLQRQDLKEENVWR